MAHTNKEQVKQYILKQISHYETQLVAKVTEDFGISKSTVYHYLSELKKDGVIEKGAETIARQSVTKPSLRLTLEMVFLAQ